MAYAASLVDNTENIWWTSLTPNHDYMIQVQAEMLSNFLWDYGLAWHITADITHSPIPPTVYLLGSGLMAILILRRKRKG